ncbi:ATP synthase F0 subunit A [Candidatus Roizmanbacteria bacterium RIFCSPHIGHO2_01_FULL_39_8]|uniref:ATP synthase subunit a n=3 Tax=Candidatus Roizmaniibacteriota TaxID=1752723 RepID=A0A1F7GF88_9BACT|nr:MAG: ATP synthase F0 subunit A [Candidatus Roizmanbacteria bacterium RIFCSPHIGHO2_01_FULL_39_8]OGK28218.1 MAG: ATP synthase F0 subunit A [Candidatus Roizmanbacteria bacterium RIFCSPHIGHO2_02_FULL_39_9]OGK35757.1 MAG: ATP synthase F0 subunit A [Candidatus Roizmanbacteria bacterium RIFCSPHIGHO2_12_FULL_39_8]
MNKGPHISIRPETLFSIGNFHVTNTYFTSLIVIACFVAIAIFYRSQIGKEKKPLFFYLIHFIFSGIYNFFQTVVGEKITYLFTLLGSLFLYILLLNWFGLLPGVGSVLVRVKEGHEYVLAPLLRGNTTDLNTTLALALVAFTATQYYGFKLLGPKEYLGKFFNFSSPIAIFTGLLELVSEFSRIISFAFRLFGNIFAGEVILVIIAFLVPILVSFPFFLLEIFVGFIQAFVFAMLTAVFINLAATKAH